MVRIAMFMLVGLMACDPENACGQMEEPAVSLGVGETRFSISDDMMLEPVFGPQGGYHFELAVRATGMLIDDPVAGELIARYDDEVVAVSRPWVGLRCNRKEKSSDATALQLVLNDDAPDLSGLDVQVQVTLQDQYGAVVRDEQTFTVGDY